MRRLRRLAGAALLAAPALSAADGAAPLRVCLLTHNAPYASREAEAGFDLDTATAAAAIIGRAFEPVWIANGGPIQEIESDMPLAELARGRCDVLFSVPGPANRTLATEPTLALGEAYYGAGFELIACTTDAPARLRGYRERTLAIQSQTVAHFAALMVKAAPRTYFAVDAALEGLVAGEADAALLWGPSAGAALAAGDHADCDPVEGYEPPAAVRWNIHAATRRTDERLRLLLNAALADLAAGGELARLAARHGVLLHPPFESTYSMGALNELQWAR